MFLKGVQVYNDLYVWNKNLWYDQLIAINISWRQKEIGRYL